MVFLLDIEVGTDEFVAEEEDLALLGLDDLPPLSIYCLHQRLAQDQ